MCNVSSKTQKTIAELTRKVFARLQPFSVKVIHLALRCALVTAASLAAQTDTANITGTVSDPTGAAIPKAVVIAVNNQTAIQYTGVTDEAGHYAIVNLPPASYNVAATAQGFSRVQRVNQRLLVGSTSSINFSLSISSVSETITVSVEPPTINPTENILSTVVQTQQMDNLPIVNRSFGALAQLSPGVQVTPASGTSTSSTVQFGDSGSFQNGFIVDGGSVQKFNNGGQLVNFAQDWIQEFSVITQQAPAQYSLSSAGFLNAITRSGGNAIHGRAYGYFQNAALNATPSFLPAKAPEKPPYNQQRLGGFLGGPVKKDKLFYFLGYEWLNNLTSTPVNMPVAFEGPGTESGVYPQTTVEHMALAKLDYQINQSQSLHIRGNEDYVILSNAGIGVSGSSVKPLASGDPSRTDGNVYQVTWDNVLSTSLLNEVRVEYAHSFSNTGCNQITILGPYPGGGSQATMWGNPTGYYATISYSGAGVSLGCPSLYGAQGERSWTFEDDTSITRGNHQLKFGLTAGNRNLYNRAIHRLADGTYTMPGSLTTPFNPAQSSSFPISYSVNWEPNNSLTNNGFNPFFGMFAQDSWRVTNALTLNIGVRYDYDFTNSLVPTLPALNPIKNDPTNLAPRAGFAWQLPHRGSSTTVIRGGFGIYYDLEHGNTGGTYYTSNTGPTDVLNFSATTASLNPYCSGNTACSAAVPAAYQAAVEQVLAYALANYQLPNFAPPGGQITLGGKTYTIPALSSTTAPTAVFNFVENFKNPGTMQTTLGVARQMGSKFDATGDFVYTKGFNEDIEYNANVNPSTYGAIYPQFTSVSTYINGGYFKGYSLRALGHYRDLRGDAAQVAYTLNYAWDNDPNAGWTLTTTQTNATNPFNFDVDYGPANVPRNVLNVSGTAKFPFAILLNPIVTYSGGVPYTATTVSRTVAGCPVYYSKCYPAGYSKGSLVGQSIFTLNGRLSKEFTLHERYIGKLMFEGYNLTNRVNYSSYQASVTSTSFTQPIAAYSRRYLQAGFQFDF